MESLTGIQTLTRLITLSVGHNGITDLSPLSGLERLNYLQLDGLEVTDFSPLADLPALGYVVVPQKQTALVEDVYKRQRLLYRLHHGRSG